MRLVPPSTGDRRAAAARKRGAAFASYDSDRPDSPSPRKAQDDSDLPGWEPRRPAPPPSARATARRGSTREPEPPRAAAHLADFRTPAPAPRRGLGSVRRRAEAAQGGAASAPPTPTGRARR